MIIEEVNIKTITLSDKDIKEGILLFLERRGIKNISMEHISLTQGTDQAIPNLLATVKVEETVNSGKHMDS